VVELVWHCAPGIHVQLDCRACTIARALEIAGAFVR